MDIGILATAAAMLLAALMGTAVLACSPRRATHRAFALMAFGTSAWMLGFIALDGFGIFAGDKLMHYGGLAIAGGFFAFSHAFPNHAVRARTLLLGFVPLALVGAFVVPFDLLIEGMEISESGAAIPINGPLLPAYGILLGAYVAHGLARLVRTFLNASQADRLKVSYAFLGVALLVLSSFVCNLMLPAWFGITALNALAPLGSMLFLASIAYAIARHQLMDIRIVIQRGVIYSLLLALIVGCYIAVVALLRAAIPAEDDAAGLLASIVTVVLGIFGVPYVERFFTALTDRVFFKDRYRYPDALRSLSQVLHDNVALTALMQESETALCRILKVPFARVLLGGAKASSDAALVVPLTLDGAEIGRIALGPKRSGDPFSRDDRQLLETFAYQAATALSRARLHAEAERHAAELEEKVEERTQELSRMHKREREIISDISHNLQTPLTVLQAKLDAMKSRSRHQEEIRSLEQSLASFSDFIYELLSLAQLDGRQQSRLERVDLSALVQELSEEVATIGFARGAKVHAAVQPSIWVEGDAQRLREMFMSIASNALKYLSEAGGTVAISLAARGGTASLSIVDTGIGIAPDELPHVFDRFNRGSGPARERAGTGLGLAIAKRIVEQHRGHIAAESAVGEGTTLSIILPRTHVALPS